MAEKGEEMGAAKLDGNVAIKANEVPDIQAIMADIRSRIKADVENNRDKKRPFKAYQTDTDKNSERKAGELLYSEELAYLNSHYVYTPRLNLDAVTSHRKGFVGKLLVKFKHKVLCAVWDHLLKDYFEEEKQYQSRLVRYLNNVSKYVDARDASNFWELIRKIDVDITKALDRIERINDEQMASIRSSERRVFDALDDSLSDVRTSIEKINTALVQHDAKLETLEGVAHGLESIVARLSPKANKDDDVKQSLEPTDYSYLMLENRFRGSEEQIKEKLKIYPPIFTGAKKPVLEIGPGRGELLDLLKDAGLKAYGVDIDKAMVEAACAKGFDSRLEDGIAHLETVADESLGGIVAIQVVEHLSQGQLEKLFNLCVKKLTKGAQVAFETINPQSVLALSSNYFRDPTHVWPLHPDTLAYTMELAGLKVSEVKMLSPVSKEAELRTLAVEDYMTPRWAFAVESLNRNLRQLNKLLYGNQDYCIIAERRD